MITVPCLWCAHTETGQSYYPHDAIQSHQISAHGARRLACGCSYQRVPAHVPEQWNWWTCDLHSAAYLRQRWELLNANYQAKRWAPRHQPAGPDQASLTSDPRS